MNRRDAVWQLTSGCLAGPWVASQSVSRMSQSRNVSAASANGQAPMPRREQVVADVIRVMEGNGVHRDPVHGSYFSGYGEGLFTVEAYFDNIALFYAGNVELGKTALRILLNQQLENGFIVRHWEQGQHTSSTAGRLPAPELQPVTPSNPYAMKNPWALYEREELAQPFLFQMALFTSRASGGDISWLDDEAYRRLKLYLWHWTSAWDRDFNGLSEWASAPHAIADTQFDRAGVWRSFYCEGADLNSFLYLEFLAAEKIALARGQREDAAYFGCQARIKKDLIQELLWDERDGFYYDRDIRTGLPIKVKSVNGLYPLWAGIPHERQARRLVQEHLMNPREFWSAYPLPSYALTERNYTQHHVPPSAIDIYYGLPEGHSNWRGGMWAHANYMVAHGLQRYGFTGEARELAAKTYELAARDPDLYEWYNAETGGVLGAHPLCAGAEVLMRFIPTELELGLNHGIIEAADKRLDKGPLRQALSISKNFRGGSL
jgi:putative isomerase